MRKHGADRGSMDSSRDKFKNSGEEQKHEDRPVGKKRGAGDAAKMRSLKGQQHHRGGCHRSADGEDVSVSDCSQAETSREKDESPESHTGGTYLTDIEVDVEVETMPSAQMGVGHLGNEEVVAGCMHYVEETMET